MGCGKSQIRESNQQTLQNLKQQNGNSQTQLGQSLASSQNAQEKVDNLNLTKDFQMPDSVDRFIEDQDKIDPDNSFEASKKGSLMGTDTLLNRKWEQISNIERNTKNSNQLMQSIQKDPLMSTDEFILNNLLNNPDQDLETGLNYKGNNNLQKQQPKNQNQPRLQTNQQYKFNSQGWLNERDEEIMNTIMPSKNDFRF